MKMNLNAALPCNNLATEVNYFIHKFWLNDGNILDACIVNNILLKVGTGNKLSLGHFRNGLTQVEIKRLTQLRLFNVINPQTNNIISIENINNYLGFELSHLEFFHIKSVVTLAKKK